MLFHSNIKGKKLAPNLTKSRSRHEIPHVDVDVPYYTIELAAGDETFVGLLYKLDTFYI
jgi:hypothetical protein